MKPLWVALLMLVAYQPDAGSIRVQVNSLRSNKGYVVVTLYNNDKGFPTDPALAYKQLKLSVRDNKAEGVFADVPYGTYALGILHDENDDGKMASNLIGIPKEGYGASNNAKGSFGPPKFNDAKFVLNAAEVKQLIKAQY